MKEINKNKEFCEFCGKQFYSLGIGMHRIHCKKNPRNISEIDQLLDSLSKDIEALFSVYPDGGMHDFAEDEELVSKKQVQELIKRRKK